MINNRIKTIRNWEDVPIIIDLSCASIILGVSIEYLKKQSQKGTFPAFKVGGAWKVEKSDLLRFIEDMKVKRC